MSSVERAEIIETRGREPCDLGTVMVEGVFVNGNRDTSLSKFEEKEEVERSWELVRHDDRKLAGVKIDQVTFYFWAVKIRVLVLSPDVS